MFAPKTVIEGLRGVGRVELAFEEGQRAYVLLGRNAVGKTKTLEALFQAALCTYLAKLRWRSGVLSPGDYVFGSMRGNQWQLEVPSRSSYPDTFVAGVRRQS